MVTPKSRPVYVVIHGHFYQPPREDPWLGRIPLHTTAYPFRDWNERINAECYRANCASRVLNEKGRILEIVNNFEYLSFNVGPTLFQWLEKNDRATYQNIISAEKKSRKFNNGVSNAVA